MLLEKQEKNKKITNILSLKQKHSMYGCAVLLLLSVNPVEEVNRHTVLRNSIKIPCTNIIKHAIFRYISVLIDWEATMNTMTLEQLRATANAGGVKGVTLKGQGGGFFIEIATRSGQGVYLAKARSTQPRRFGNPVSALVILHDVGIDHTQFDTTEWDPAAKDTSRARPTRAAALREAHEAAAYSRWLSAEISESMADTAPNLTHDEAMNALDEELAQLTSSKKKHS